MITVLIGHRGTGKSDLIKRLQLYFVDTGTEFVDLDQEIERKIGRSIRELFMEQGEAYFRDGERRVIARLIDGGPSVIATGGGAFAQPVTRALILERGLAVWLDADVDTLLDRVRRKDTRPLLRDGDPREIVTRLKAEREAAYAEAPIHVPSAGGPHGDTVARIVQELDRWL